MNELYFRRLKDLILPAPNGRRYNLLLNKLYSEEFIPRIERDVNRALDGAWLRDYFGSKVTENFEIGCTMLEMLIALAGRFDGNSGFDVDEVYSNFWQMMENVGLDFYDDNRYSEREVWGILKILQDRTYDFSGKGGLFPLKHPEKDQRNVEIWDQMQAWEIENFES